jgi:hypothetical protein
MESDLERPGTGEAVAAELFPGEGASFAVDFTLFLGVVTGLFFSLQKNQ